MATLVLGATGFIGSPVVRALRRFGVEVVAASRNGGGPEGSVSIDRGDVGQVMNLVRTRRVTTVIDLLAFTEGSTLPLLAALDGHVERWVMVSSCDVYRNYEGLHRAADPAPILEALSEHSALRTCRYPYRQTPLRAGDSADAWMDHYDKIPLEDAVRSRPGLSGVILRLPMVYGPGDRQRRFRWIVTPMLSEKPRLAVDPSWASWRTTYGYVDDVADAIATAALHRAAAGRTFNVGEADPTDHLAWIGRFAEVLGWRGEVDLVAAPSDSPLAALNLAYPMATDTRLFREQCGWRDPTPRAEAIALTAMDEAGRS
jgi:nucleoside-diphosphate-sugar epimerase